MNTEVIGWFEFRDCRIHYDGDTVEVHDINDHVAGLSLDVLERLVSWNSTRGLITPPGLYPLSAWGDCVLYDGEQVVVHDQFGGSATLSLDEYDSLCQWAEDQGIV